MWQSMISYLLAIYSYFVKHSSIVYSKFFEKQRFGEREGMKILLSNNEILGFQAPT